MSDDYMPRYTAGVRMVLDVLATGDSPMWGKRIIHLTQMQSGSVYPVLIRLEKAGWVTSYWEDSGPGLGRPVRHYYQITDEGRARRDAENERLEKISGEISAPAVPEPVQPYFQAGTSVPFRSAV